jgi:hypothetical protein
MLQWYKRFCCGIFYLLKEKAKSDIPFFATFMFTLFLFVLIVYGADSLIAILLKTKYNVSRYLMFGLVFIVAIPNYLVVFKDNKFLDFYDKKLSHLKVIISILLIFVLSLGFVLMGGVRGSNG